MANRISLEIQIKGDWLVQTCRAAFDSGDGGGSYPVTFFAMKEPRCLRHDAR